MNNQIQQIVALFLSFPQMLAVWNATSFVFSSAESVGFKVSTPYYNGVVRITFTDASFYIVEFQDADLRILGLLGAERVLDVVKDYVEKGEVWV